MTKKMIMHIGAANARIRELEERLGIADTGARFLNAHKAHSRIQDLEARLAANPPAAASPTPATPATPTPAPAPPATAGRPTRAQLLQIISVLSPLSAAAVRVTWSDENLFLEAERAAFQAYVTFPGRRTDAVLANEFWRKSADARSLAGLSRYLQSRAQAAVDKILATPVQAKRPASSSTGIGRIMAAAAADLAAAGYIPKSR